MEYTIVGHIQNTHGINGDLKIKPMTDFIDRFEEDVNYYIGEEKTEVQIERYRVERGLLFVHFKGFNNINDVLSFKGQYLYVNKKDRYQLEEGRFYIDDIIGFKGIFNGEMIGTLKEVLTYAANDVFVFQNEKEEIMIPAVKAFIHKIDVEKGEIIVTLIEGMR